MIALCQETNIIIIMETEVHEGLFYSIEFSTWMRNFMSYSYIIVIIRVCPILS